MNSSTDNDNSNAENVLLQPTISTFDHTSGTPEGFLRLQTEINQMYVQDEANLNNPAAVINSSRGPEVYRHSTNIVGNGYLRDQPDSRVGTLADTPNIPNIVTSTAITDNYDHDFPRLESIRRPQTINGNYERNFPPLRSIWRSRINRQSVSIGSRMNLGGQQDNQVETLVDTSNTVTATANNDHFDHDNPPLESIWRPQINGQSTSIGSSNMNLGGQRDNQVETLVDTSNTITATTNNDTYERDDPPLESVWRPQINRQSMGIGSSNMNLERQQLSQVETLADNIDIATANDNFERDNPLRESIWRPQMSRQSMSIGSSNMNLGGQPDSQVETLADTPNIVTNAGVRAHLQRVIAANIARNNSNIRGTIPGLWRPQVHGHMIFDRAMMNSVRSSSPFHPEQVLSHGFNHSLVGDSQSYPPAGATLNNDKNAVPYRPHAFHDHMIPYNANAGINSSSSNIVQTSQGIGQNYSPRQRSEFQEIRHQNTNAYNRLNVHPGEALRPLSINQESFLANQPVWAWGTMAGNRPDAAMSVPNISAVHTEMHQGYVNNVGATSRHPSLMPPLGSGAGRTTGPNQSGAVNSSREGHARFRLQRQPAELELGDRVGPSQHPEVLRQSAVRDDSFRPYPTAIFPTPERRRMEPQPTTHESEACPYHERATGVNCPICRRDSSLTPSGPVSQPATPPPTAVLPCQHVYHAECLRNITPRDQESNPPCIACALGAASDSN